MQRALLFVLAFLLQLQYATAQTQKLVKINYDYAYRKVIFPPLIQQLTKEETYKIVMPKKLTYYMTQEDIFMDIWNPLTAYIDLKAKANQVSPDYIFEITTNGASNIDNSQAPRYYKTTRYEANNTSKVLTGLVRDYTCNFPVTLTVKNKNGEVLRTIEIAGEKEVFTAVLHKDMLMPGNTPHNPFFSELALTDFESFHKIRIQGKVEQLVGIGIFARIQKTIGHLYNTFNSGRELYSFGFVKPKDRPYDYSDLDNALAQYKTALDSMDNGNLETCKTLCASAKAVFEKAYGSNEPRIDANVKRTLELNLAHVNLLLQNFDEAWRYYRLLLASGFEDNVPLITNLRGRIDMHQTFYQLKAKLGS